MYEFVWKHRNLIISCVAMFSTLGVISQRLIEFSFAFSVQLGLSATSSDE